MTLDKFRELSNKVEKLSEQIESNPNVYPLPERWLDNDAARKVLNVSSRTLQNYRDQGIISFSQFGSKIYYRAIDIQKHLEKHYKPAFRK